MTQPTVLVIDDDSLVRDAVGDTLRRAGFQVAAAPDGASAIEIAHREECAVAVVDLVLPDVSGMEITRRIGQICPDTEIVILTGNASLDSAIEALEEHVYDFLCKPVSVEKLTRAVKNAAERHCLRAENRELLSQVQQERDELRQRVGAAQRALEKGLDTSELLLGQSEAMVHVRHLIATVAPSDMTVLIRGESGTGKDVVARLIHECSGRQHSGPLERINCPAIPEQLLESEMFGHERGAFTGAVRCKPGRFEIGNGGTAFLDEIGSISLAVQAKLLQVIELKQFTRVGGKEVRHVNVRIVAATNSPLEEMIAQGEFRSDLFYRLKQFTISLSPLRERTEDIPLLAQHFLRRYGPRYGRSDLSLPRGILAQMVSYNWPGNVRELEALMERFALTDDPSVVEKGLKDSHSTANGVYPDQTLHDSEVKTIMSALFATKWNRRRAATLLGISYSALRRRIAKYDLERVEHTCQLYDPKRAGEPRFGAEG